MCAGCSRSFESSTGLLSHRRRCKGDPNRTSSSQAGGTQLDPSKWLKGGSEWGEVTRKLHAKDFPLRTQMAVESKWNWLRNGGRLRQKKNEWSPEDQERLQQMIAEEGTAEWAGKAQRLGKTSRELQLQHRRVLKAFEDAIDWSAAESDKEFVCETCSAVHDGSFGNGRYCREACRREAYGAPPQKRDDSDEPLRRANEALVEQRRAAGEQLSKFIGVTWAPHVRKWRASITVNKRSSMLGEFHSEEDAAWAYDARARRAWPTGKNANDRVVALNFPNDKKRPRDDQKMAAQEEEEQEASPRKQRKQRKLAKEEEQTEITVAASSRAWSAAEDEQLRSLAEHEGPGDWAGKASRFNWPRSASALGKRWALLVRQGGSKSMTAVAAGADETEEDPVDPKVLPKAAPKSCRICRRGAGICRHPGRSGHLPAAREGGDEEQEQEQERGQGQGRAPATGWSCEWCHCSAGETSGKGPGPNGSGTLCASCAGRFRKNPASGPLLQNEDGTYTCDGCGRTFETKAGLGGHRKACDGGNWACEWCQCSAGETSGKARGPSGSGTLCSKCGSRWQNGATGPLLQNKDGTYSCDKCSRCFDTVAGVAGHMARCTGVWRGDQVVKFLRDNAGGHTWKQVQEAIVGRPANENGRWNDWPEIEQHRNVRRTGKGRLGDVYMYHYTEAPRKASSSSRKRKRKQQQQQQRQQEAAAEAEAEADEEEKQLDEQEEQDLDGTDSTTPIAMVEREAAAAAMLREILAEQEQQERTRAKPAAVERTKQTVENPQVDVHFKHDAESGRLRCMGCDKLYPDAGQLKGHFTKGCDGGAWKTWRCEWCHCSADETSKTGSGPNGRGTLCNGCACRFGNGATGPMLQNKDGTYACDKCDRTFETKAGLGGHMARCDGGKWACDWCHCSAEEAGRKGPGPNGGATLCGSCAGRFRKGAQGPLLQNEDGTYTCDGCGRTFETVGGIAGHVVVCTGESRADQVANFLRDNDGGHTRMQVQEAIVGHRVEESRKWSNWPEIEQHKNVRRTGKGRAGDVFMYHYTGTRPQKAPSSTQEQRKLAKDHDTVERRPGSASEGEEAESAEEQEEEEPEEEPEDEPEDDEHDKAAQGAWEAHFDPHHGQKYWWNQVSSSARFC